MVYGNRNLLNYAECSEDILNSRIVYEYGSLLSMAEPKTTKLNQLEKQLPEGLVVDSLWLSEHGFATNLRSHYVTTGRLEQPARRVYRRPYGKLSWQQVVISLQTLLLRSPLTVGGRTALELQGYAHFLSHAESEVH